VERLKSKYFVAFLIGYLVCMLVSLPSFVYADVTIDNARNTTVFLADEPGHESKMAYVTSTGSVDTGNQQAIYVTENGWSINVASGRLVKSTFGGAGGYGIIFQGLGGDSSSRSGTLNNQGVISGYTGIKMGSGTIYNYGSITGNGGSGIAMNASTGTVNITNSGTITGAADHGINITGVGNKTITNSGTITGTGANLGIYSSGGNTTILNYGTIESTTGMAIWLGGSNNRVTLGTGSVINGIIRAFDYNATNAMILDGQGTIVAGQILNFGTLNKTGAGTWKLTGDKDYTSDGQLMPITVETGILTFGARSAVGTGVKTNTFVQNAGASLGFAVQSPGLTVGPVTTTLTGELRATTANFNNGTIVVIPTVGTYPTTTTYLNVLTVGTAFDVNNTKWSQVTSTSAFLSPSLAEQGTSQVYDLVLNRMSLSTGASSNGNASLGVALDGMYEDATADMRNILDQLIVLGAGAAQTALSQMGGGTLNAFQFMSFYGLNQYHGALNNHLGGGSGFTGGLGHGMAANQYGYPQGMQMAFAAGGNTLSDAAPMLLAMAGTGGQLASGINWDLWLDGYYSQGNRRADDIIAQYKQTLYGALMGFDYRATDRLLVGLSLGLSQTDVKFDNLQDEGRQNSYQGSVYTYYDGKPWYAEGVLTYGYNKYKMDRFFTVGSISRLANSDYKGNEYSGYAEVGYKFDAGGVLEIRPLAAFQAAYLMQDGYTETGAGDLNLIVDSRNTGSYQSYLGLQISKAITMGNFVLTPDARAKWAHEFSDDNHLINAKFSSAGSGSFNIETDRPSRDTAIVGVGLTGRFNKNLSAYIQYDAELNKDYTNHTGMMGLRLSW
jgi:uncharacterized protein with beta-barrel porin domain